MSKECKLFLPYQEIGQTKDAFLIHRFRWAELQLAVLLDENIPFRLAEDVISKLGRRDEEVGLPDLGLVYDEISQKNTRVGMRDRENVVKTLINSRYIRSLSGTSRI